MFDVIGIGAHSVDDVYRLPGPPDFHGLNAKLRISSHAVSCGGQVATALATSAALGLRAAYAGALGRDAHGDTLVRELTARGVDLSLCQRRDGDSQHALILVDETSGERVVLWTRPPTLALTDADLPAEAIASARVLLVDDVDARAARAAARLARDAGVPVVTDLDHLTSFTRDIIAAASHPILSEHLPLALTGAADLGCALRAMRWWTPGVIVVTQGKHGATALVGDEIVHADGFPVNVVDATGSGDVFRGAFVAGLLEGRSLPDMLRLANAAAALSCQQAGALNGVPTRDQVMALAGR